jgi:uncharacterized protein YbcI
MVNCQGGFIVLSEDKRSSIIDVTDGIKLDDIQRRKLQHEFKLYMEQYFKRKLGKGVDHTKIVIWEDMLILRGEGFLTEPEKYIVATAEGELVVRAARLQVARQHSLDNVPYFEERLQAKVIHQTYDIEPENDFWMHVMVFNRILTQ